VLGVIVGLKYFGFTGLIFGPLIISYFLLLIRIYYIEYQKPDADAEEAVQDAFDKVWVNAARYNPAKAAVGTWFYRILTNTCLNMARKRPPEFVTLDVIEEVVADEEKGQDERLMAHREGLRVRMAVQSLSERQRLAVVLCYFEDMTNPEAAQVMGLHVKALEGLLVRARKLLREILYA
jgi:RNA polymerase sigma-70 factor (ECF subfamily)